MLKEIQDKAVKIKNTSDTLRWGSCLNGDTLVLTCGHPSVKSASGITLYFVVTEREGKTTIRSEVGLEPRETIQVLVPEQAIDFILKTLKEVF